MTRSRLTFSSARDFLNCPRKYHWRYVLELVPIESDGSLSIGHAFHSALESLYKLDMAGKPRDAAAIASII